MCWIRAKVYRVQYWTRPILEEQCIQINKTKLPVLVNLAARVGRANKGQVTHAKIA